MSMSETFRVEARGETEIVISRSFDAPRGAVWRAITEPELLKRWLFGPPGWTMTVCEGRPEVGGAYRWAWEDTDGHRIAMHGVFKEVDAPARMVRTEIFDTGCPDQSGEQVGTLTLDDADGRTGIRIRLVYPSREARDGALSSGMEHGMAAGYDRLDDILVDGAHA